MVRNIIFFLLWTLQSTPITKRNSLSLIRLQEERKREIFRLSNLQLFGVDVYRLKK